MAVSDFYRGRFPFRTPGGPFYSLSIGKSYDFRSFFCYRESYLRNVSSYKSLYPRVKCLCWIRIFPAAVSRSGHLAGRFRAYVSENQTSFARNSLTGSPICPPSLPTSHSTLDLSARADFGFLPQPFPVPDPRRAALEPKYRKSDKFHL